MKAKKDIQLELLMEADEICSKKGLSYVLTGLNALNAYLNHTIKKGPITVMIAMTEGDLKRFCEIIEKEHEDRYVEGRFNNPNHEDDYVFYGNKNTTEFNMLKSEDKIHNGINIQIYPITISKSKENLSRSKVLRKIKSRLKKDEEERFLNEWKDIQDYRLVNLINKNYKAEIFREIKKINVDGIELSIPKDSDGYFKKMYGKNFKNRQINEKTQADHIIIDTEHGYEEVIVEIEDLVLESRKNREEIDNEREEAIDDYNEILKIWQLVEMTNKQLELRKYFEENSDKILSYDMNNEQEFKSLYNDLNDTIKALNKYSKHGMTFSINPEIDQLIEKVLMKKGRLKLLEKIRELSKQEYFIE